MIYFCLLLPACVSMAIQYKRNDMRQNSVLAEMFRFGCWVLGINILTMIVIIYFLGVSGVMADAFNSFSFAIKYTIIAMTIAVTMTYVVEIINKYFSITFTVGEKDEEN